MTFDDGYFYPGPAVKGVTIDQAPAKSQEVIKKYGRPEYAKLLADASARGAAERRCDGRRVPEVGPRDRLAEVEANSRMRSSRVR
jgi:hypothetical protein